MQKTGQKVGTLKSRAEALGRELARMEADIKTLSRAAQHPDREVATRRLRRFAEEQETGRERPLPREASGSDDAMRPVRQPMAREPELPAESKAVPTLEAVPKEPSDSRFAKYFVTGSLHSARPLRQERRVQRNKAIVMTILAAVLLYGVFSLIF